MFILRSFTFDFRLFLIQNIWEAADYSKGLTFLSLLSNTIEIVKKCNLMIKNLFIGGVGGGVCFQTSIPSLFLFPLLIQCILAYMKFPIHSSGHKEVFNISCFLSLHPKTVTEADGKVRDQHSILRLWTVRAFQNESVQEGYDRGRLK